MLLLSEGYQVALTLWGNHAETLTIQADDVISAQKISVGDYQGCSLNTIPRSNVEINPNVEEAKALKTWWDEQGSKTELVPIGSVTGLQSVGSTHSKDCIYIPPVPKKKNVYSRSQDLIFRRRR